MKPGLINNIVISQQFYDNFNDNIENIVTKVFAIVANANDEVICKAIIKYAKDNGYNNLNIIDKKTLTKIFNDAVKYQQIKTIEEELGLTFEEIVLICKVDLHFNRISVKVDNVFRDALILKRNIQNKTFTCTYNPINNQDSTASKSVIINFKDFGETWKFRESK